MSAEAIFDTLRDVGAFKALTDGNVAAIAAASTLTEVAQLCR